MDWDYARMYSGKSMFTSVVMKVAPGVEMTLWKRTWIVIRSAVGVIFYCQDSEAAVNCEADAFALGLVWFDANDDAEIGVLTACG